MNDRLSSNSHPWQEPWPLDGKVAVIVGGSGGIGLAIAREFDRLGSHVAVAARSPERVTSAVAQLERGVGFANCDVRSTADVDRLFDGVLDRFGVVDLVINAAGVGRAASGRIVPSITANLDEREWSEVVDTNLRGGFLVARRAAQAMIPRRQGQIVSISSARGAKRGQPFAAGYCAAKMALRAMFDSLAAELRPYGIRAWSILPDAVDTELIAGTNLAHRGSLTASCLAETVAELVTLPFDAQWSDPLVAPFGSVMPVSLPVATCGEGA
jgi:NAD(P)-dependent dehydrogenase (short-subunit alcohol dehydrogenase family)